MQISASVVLKLHSEYGTKNLPDYLAGLVVRNLKILSSMVLPSVAFLWFF